MISECACFLPNGAYFQVFGIQVLLTSPEAVLSRLPPALVAEAQMLRDRRSNNRYHYRNALFGGSHRLDGRRLAVNRQTVMDRGVGVTIGRRILYANPSTSKDKEVEGMALLDANALKALIRLLRLAQVLLYMLMKNLFCVVKIVSEHMFFDDIILSLCMVGVIK